MRRELDRANHFRHPGGSLQANPPGHSSPSPHGIWRWLGSPTTTTPSPQVDPLANDEEPAEVRQRRVEAVLFMAREPLSSRKIAHWTGLADATEARTLIRRLNDTYDQQGRSIRIEEVAGGFQLRTRPQFAKWLRRLEFVPGETRLTQPALETLSIVAYRQPILRAELEAIRGVGCGEVLRQLMQRDLVRICGRSEDLGRPYLYGTTTRFLQLFGLKTVEHLPRFDKVRELDQMIASSLGVVNSSEMGSQHATLGILEGSETKESIVRMTVAANGLTRTLKGTTLEGTRDELVDPRRSQQFGTYPVAASDEDFEEEFEDEDEEDDEEFDDEEDEEFEDEEFEDEEVEEGEDEEEFDEDELEDDEEWEEVEGDEEEDEDEDEDEEDDWSDDDDEDWDDDEDEDEDEDWE